ncbi:aldehyde dehydrogenase (NADP(+)) [Maribacter sp. LLG6340-A2]|uniref:aldehyde dehydrogenase (NADP(+)) n=1 Tax=Maribacter sp. LLG6340-A2 TaxID=3160834 RepID=UPI00386A699C
MNLTGDNFIGFKKCANGDNTFQAFSPSDNEYLPLNFTRATQEEFEKALLLAKKAFIVYRKISYERRAQFLDSIANEIMNLGDILLERCVQESGLTIERITGERGRTCNQLRLFAQLLRDGTWLDARIDKPQPNRQPIPKSDIRRMLIPIGPVAVYGASNFPLAFSTAGGDTASALASGCPVIIKAHSSHPGTNALVSSAIIKAAKDTGMPEGVFSSLYLSHKDSVKLVEHPIIKAVGFTGSQQVGMTLFKAAVNRMDPIPVFAEMSSINPVILMENALEKQKSTIAKGLAASINLGVGQFCTNPGLVLIVDNESSIGFLEEFIFEFKKSLPGTMLNKNIHNSCINGVKTLIKNQNITLIAKAEQIADLQKTEGQPVVFSVNAAEFLSNKALSEEVFGPVTLFVICKNSTERLEVLDSLGGQLTATIHAVQEDEDEVTPVINIITQKAGRIIYGGYPTGVEVGHSMQHGGPFPATTNANSTSVGSAAILRFVRPVAFQDFPDVFLPDALKNGNPLNVMRLVDGNFTKNMIE